MPRSRHKVDFQFNGDSQTLSRNHKFVDTVFDNGENLAVRPRGIHEYFRHTICCTIDDMLTSLNQRLYWSAFLSGNRDDLKRSFRNALTYLDRHVKDRRLYEVIRDALQFAIRHPDQFTLPHGWKSVPDRTPNMVAFTDDYECCARVCERTRRYSSGILS